MGIKRFCVKTDLIENGGFEAGLEPWITTGTVSVLPAVVDQFPAVRPHEGGFLAQLEPGSSISQTIEDLVCPNMVYRLGIFLSSPNIDFSIDISDNSGTNVSVQFIDIMGNPLGTPDEFNVLAFTQDTNGEGGWNYHQLLTSLSPNGTTGAIVTIRTNTLEEDPIAFNQTPNGIRVDDVSFIREN
ncbi:hypothetical protein [Neobacillus niacini]|uniref:hypothetical protein n=1 Tax=Neobacillus niacini TaxID=86668 RepID=UPI0039832507